MELVQKQIVFPLTGTTVGNFTKMLIACLVIIRSSWINRLKINEKSINQVDAGIQYENHLDLTKQMNNHVLQGKEYYMFPTKARISYILV